MSAQRPVEPSSPSPPGTRPRAAWLVGWIAVAAGLGVALGVLWVASARVEVLGVVAGLAMLAVAVPLHHLVVTLDRGEQHVARADVRPDGRIALGRRQALLGGASLAALLVAASLGLRRLGRVPPVVTAWAPGSRLTTITGRHLRAADLPPGGVVTVWPEGAVGTERAAVMVIRLRQVPQAPTLLSGVVDDTLVAYSRLCTHAGCAVALYRDHDQALFCPCHQATFDATRGAVPTAGPASVALPQLPIAVGPDGYLVAAGELTSRPGPVGGRVAR